MSDRSYGLQAARLGRQLRQRRHALGLTQREVAELAATSQRSVSLIENGKPTARLDVIVALAQALGLELVAVGHEQAADLVRGSAEPT